MMPPTSIDGTDITGATIDGTDVQEITVDGQTVFTAGPTIIDDFESQSLSDYDNLSGFSINTANPINGTASLEIPSSGTNSCLTNSKPNIPTLGDSFSVLVKASNWSNGQVYICFDAANDFVPFQRDSGGGNYVRLDDEFNIFNIGQAPNGGSSGTTFNYSNGALYRVEVSYGSNLLEAELFENGSSVATISHTPGQSYTNGHIGISRLSRSSFTALVDDFILTT